MREPDGEGQGPSAGLEFGPSGHQEGQEREAKAALSPHDAACPGAGLNGSLVCLWDAGCGSRRGK